MSNDGLQIKIAVMCIVISVFVTALTPALLPEWDAEDADALEDARDRLSAFSGESMISKTPWKLTSVRTPYTANAQENILTTYGWIYGSIEYNYSLDGEVYLAGTDNGDGTVTYTVTKDIIRLDPSQRSTQPLSQGQGNTIGMVQKAEYEGFWGGVWYGLTHLGGILDLGSAKYWNDMYEPGVVSGNAFDFTGLMYHFDPYYRIDTSNNYNVDVNSDMGSFNIVWYDGAYGSGISGGLIIQSDSSNALIANYSSTEIIANANTSSNYATKYLLDFDGVQQVNMYIMFDTPVIATGYSLQEAWDAGYWSIAFVSPSADGLLDTFNSKSLSNSLGSLLDTYIAIFTFNMPNVPVMWEMVLWVICVIPLDLALILYLSRFGQWGLLGGIVAAGLGLLTGALV